MSENLNITGTWQLRSFVTEFEDGSTLLPYGKTPRGWITYTPGGFMSAHLWNPDTHVKGKPPGEDPAYFSYCGDWVIEGSTVRHSVHAATEPSWTGQDKFRTMRWHDRLLELTAENVVFARKTGRGILIWEKRPNQD